MIRNAGHIDPEFTEAKKALEKLDTSKGRGLGKKWFDWWWSKDRETEERKKMKNIIFLKKLFLVVLFFVAIVTFGRLTYKVILQDFYDPMNKFFSIIVDYPNNLFNRINQGNIDSTIDSTTVGNTTVKEIIQL